MSSVIQTIFDILFPPSQDEQIVRVLSTTGIPTLLYPREADGITILSHFDDTRIAALIHEAKFHRNKRAMGMLALLLHTYMCTLPKTEQLVFVPMPLAHTRERERGYNQVAEILKSVAKEHPVTTAEHILKRTRNTAPQTELPREKRLANVRDAFAAQRDERFLEVALVLLDDVATTGATLTEAKRALNSAGYQNVRCIALAG